MFVSAASAHDFVFTKDGMDQLRGQHRLWDHGLEIYRALFLPLKDNVWRFLIQSDSKSMQLLLYFQLLREMVRDNGSS